MAARLAANEVDIFARAAVRIAAKRRALGPDAVAALSRDIVSTLAARHPDGDASATGPADLPAFCATLQTRDAEAALTFLATRRAEGVSRHDIYTDYIAAAARFLGAAWDSNRLSLTEVSVATGHLYALMRAMGAERPPADRDGRRSALFAAVPGEDHALGITVAAGLFRDAGWDIDLQVGRSQAELLARAEATRPSVVGLSLSTAARLSALARLVVGLRLALPHAILGVAPAARLDAATLDHMLDIDLVLGDADSARTALERLVADRP
ncbi:MAG: cobalamin B12-binding domain-containing protein [Alkalilacustris sp.]